MSRPFARTLAIGALLAAAAISAPAAAAPNTAPPDDIGGERRPASPPGEYWRRFLDALLFVPRTLVQVAVIASTTTVSFFEDQQVVPRARALLGTEDGKVRVAPTISLASGFKPDVGARLTIQQGRFASMVRGSIVSRDSYVTETRLLYSLGATGRTQLILEGLHQRATDIGYVGVGPDPTRDTRNAFQPGKEGSGAVFLEVRERVIAGLATRTGDDVELLFSSSFQRRTIDDVRDPGVDTFALTFVPGSVPGAYARSDRFYTEAAVRRDTRAVRGPPAAGLLVEAYAGTSEDAHDTFANAFHGGARASAFIPVVRKTSILNPRLTLDAIAPVGEHPLPFREYSYAAGYRGVDPRVDLVAALASIDYRWQLISYVAARLFVDVTTVAPKVPALRPDHLAWAVGGGIDLHSSTTELGRLGISYSSGGVQLILVYGLAGPGFGDRQHR